MGTLGPARQISACLFEAAQLVARGADNVVTDLADLVGQQ
jgi:hypothetical protein